MLVPCRSNRELFAEATGKPVTVVPHVCRGSRSAAGEDELDDFRRRLGIEAGRHVFYSINDWNSRKAPWELVDAYLRAFDADDPVVLVLKTAPRGPRCAEDRGSAPTRGQVEEMRARYRHPADVIVIDRALPEREIEMLHMAGDTFVSMARSEGWGLGMFDAAGFGKPVIATGWGGHLDYLDPRHATLLEYSLEPVVDAAGYPSYAPDQNWARANPDAAVAAMRDHAARRDHYRQRAAPLAAAIQRRFNADKVGRILHDTLGLN